MPETSYDKLIATRTSREQKLRKTLVPKMEREIAEQLDHEEYVQKRRELSVDLRRLFTSRTLKRTREHKIDVDWESVYEDEDDDGPFVFVHPLVAVVEPDGVIYLYYTNYAHIYQGVLYPRRFTEMNRDRILARALWHEEMDSVYSYSSMPNSHMELVIDAIQKLSA